MQGIHVLHPGWLESSQVIGLFKPKWPENADSYNHSYTNKYIAYIQVCRFNSSPCSQQKFWGSALWNPRGKHGNSDFTHDDARMRVVVVVVVVVTIWEWDRRSKVWLQENSNAFRTTPGRKQWLGCLSGSRCSDPNIRASEKLICCLVAYGRKDSRFHTYCPGVSCTEVALVHVRNGVSWMARIVDCPSIHGVQYSMIYSIILCRTKYGNGQNK